MGRGLKTLADRGLSGGRDGGFIHFITPGTYSWIAPSGVTSICAVCVGPGGISTSNTVTSCSISRGGTTLVSAFSGIGGSGALGGSGGVKHGGGNGGNVAGDHSGGAGGYSGNGGNGGSVAPAGGGGAGGSGSIGPGGVGLFGEGPSGASVGKGGSYGQSSVSIEDASDFGGGYPYRGSGGELSWVNDVIVTPGETLTVVVAAPQVGAGDVGGRGAVAIYWRMGSFPELPGINKEGWV